MKIRIGYEFVYACPQATPMILTLRVHPTHPQPRLVRLAAKVLRSGGVIAYPTDSCYALGCRIGDAQAAEKLLGAEQTVEILSPQLRRVDSG